MGIYMHVIPLYNWREFPSVYCKYVCMPVCMYVHMYVLINCWALVFFSFFFSDCGCLGGGWADMIDGIML